MNRYFVSCAALTKKEMRFSLPQMLLSSKMVLFTTIQSIFKLKRKPGSYGYGNSANLAKY